MWSGGGLVVCGDAAPCLAPVSPVCTSPLLLLLCMPEVVCAGLVLVVVVLCGPG